MIDNEIIIGELEDEELKLLLRHINTNQLLHPMRKDKKKYAQQIKNMGKIDPKSSVVKAVLPGTVCTLVHKGDPNYLEIISKELDLKREKITEFIKDNEKDIPLAHDNPESYASLYWAYIKAQGEICEEDYFWILLWIAGEEIDSSLKERVHNCIEQLRKNEEVAAEHEEEIEKLRQEHINEIERLKKTHLKEIKDITKSIQSLKGLIQEKEESLERSWENENRSKHEAALKTLNDEYKEKQAQLIEEYQQKKAKLSSELEDKSKDLMGKYEDLENSLKEQCLKHTKEKESLEIQKQELARDIEELNQRKTQLQSCIDEYFEHLEEHVLRINLDHYLDAKVSGSVFASIKSNVPVASHDQKHIVVYGGEEIQNGDKYDKPCELEDVLSDLSDNISIYFKTPNEVANTVLAIINNKKLLLVDSAAALKLGNSISALLDAKTITVLDCNDGNYSLTDIIQEIESLPVRTVLLDGILDRFDDKILSGIYASKGNKVVLVSYPDLDCIKLISKKIFQYAIPIYLDEYLKFSDERYFVIGEYDLLDFMPQLEPNGLKLCYDNHFKTLKNKGYITQSMALDLAVFYYAYKEITKEGKTSDLIKESIINIINSNDDTDEAQSVLKEIDLL